ncbi:MAG: hypothetical protein AAB568_02035 [Patescibacteria group bacterium]
MFEVVKVHKMKIVRGEKYHCGDSGCDGHVPATLVCSCGYEREFNDPSQQQNHRMKYEHAAEVIKTAGFIFDLVE